jgi:hypothetical protein
LNTPRITVFFILIGAIVFVAPVQAQRRFASARARRTNLGLLRHAHRSTGDSGFPGYFYPDYFAYDSEPDVAEPPPQNFAAQPQPAPAPPPKPPESVMLELQGDHWVRVTNHGVSVSGEESAQRESEQSSHPSPAPRAALRRTEMPQLGHELPPTALVFRDGHQEEIEKYVILGKAIYVGGEYERTGSSSRKVQIVDLDVSATLALNRERGTRFHLPSSPNEVVVRP